ncbi:MAG TPA: type IV toxin-antitoxin system AbiEi family antitoxin domain-containing protein [Solirubrobacteraceae bacterium]
MRIEWQITRAHRGKTATRAIDAGIADLARVQHGLVALGQLRAIGLSDDAVHGWAERGRLHRVHRGVYAVGHPLLDGHGRWLAAVLACGPGAALSHRPAAALWGLLTDTGGVEVTQPSGTGRSRPGIAVHRSDLTRDVTAVAGIPVTTVARTLCDLAGSVPRRALERAVAEAEVRRLDVGDLDARLRANAGRRGAARLRAVLDDRTEPALTRSELEERVLALCDRGRMPKPSVNEWISLSAGSGVEADFLWQDKRLVLEADSRTVHATTKAFEADRRRDQRLAIAGYRVIRTTHRQVVHRPAELARTLARLLTTSG